MSEHAADRPGPTAAGTERIVFLDVLRAFAIMMMLQGHFVDTMLDDRYRDLGNPIYFCWSFMRGITAPVFFFVSGAVFVFLTLRESAPWQHNLRIRKGFRRALLLLCLGYVLKWNVVALLWTFEFYPSYFLVDVFHIMGLSLLALIAVIVWCQRFGLAVPLVFLTLALAAFLVAPEIRSRDWSALPVFLQNYLVKSNGSTFTIFPWIGFALFGGMAGWLMHARPHWLRSPGTPALLFLSGLAIHLVLGGVPSLYDPMTGWPLFAGLSNHIALFRRMGHVLVVLSIFIGLVRWAGSIPPLVTKIGRETLTIYSMHYVVLYGTWFGVGIQSLGRGTWPPWATTIGALIFVGCFVYLIHRIEDVRRLFGQAATRATDALGARWHRRQS